MGKAMFIAGLLVSYFSVMGTAQTMAQINELTAQHQRCLDQGADMMGCSSRFYSQMDSILNLAYNKLRKTLPAKDKEKLKQEELTWLKKRDEHHKASESKWKKELGQGNDTYMIIYDEDADFTKARAIALIKR